MRVHFSVLQRQDFESEGTREARRHERGGFEKILFHDIAISQ